MDLANKIELKNNETSKPSFKTDYTHFMKNPNILADRIVEIYDNNPNANVYNPKIKDKPVRLQNVINKIEKDENIDGQYKEFVNEFRNIPNNTKIKYDYKIYKNLVLDKINNEEIEPYNDESFIKEVGKDIGKNFIKKMTIRNNHERKLNNKYLHDDMIISNNIKNAIIKNTNINKLSKNEYHVYTLLSKYKMIIQIF